MQPSAFSSTTWNPEVGEFINDDHARLQELLSKYDRGRYTLLYIPGRKRQEMDDRVRPWAIKERNSQTGEEYIVRYMSDEDMADPAGVMAWILEGDMLRVRPIDALAKIEAREKAERLLMLARRRDEMEDKKQYAAFLVSGGKDHKSRVQTGRGRYFQVD